MRRFFAPLLLVVMVVAYVQLYPGVWKQREQLRLAIPAGYTIPSKYSRILAIGHDGLLSDYLFLKVATFFGGRIVSGYPLNEDDWQFVIQGLDVITDLDPYFVDPYMLVEGLLAWDAGKPHDANRLLAKGMKHRDFDWRLPFFIGFNQFYFLKDYKSASSYIMKASQLPGSPAYLSTLGARLAYYGGKSKTALLFLKDMLAEASDPLLKNRLQTRLLALERAVEIEEALDRFREFEGGSPDTLSELVVKGYLDELPRDPYGGDWVILENGRVFSTSKFASPKAQGAEVPK